MTTPIRILPAALLLALTACGDDANPASTTITATASATNTTTDGDTDSAGETSPPPDETTDDSPTTTATTDPPATSGTTEDATDTTAGESSSTTDPVNPCDQCAPDATCEDGECACKDGYEGDGQTCDDLDECAGKNDCDIDAACSNTPGGYECECNAGYKGNGFDCENIDECTQDLDDCDENASCTDQDGGFKCACNEGYTGDGKTCNGSKEYGDPCTEGSECASGLCLTGDPSQCTVTCTQAVANDCGAQDLAGLCIEIDADMDLYVCAGDLTFGADPDDAIIANDGEQLVRNFQSVTDADLFMMKLPAAKYEIAAFPDPDDTIKVEFYNGDATDIGSNTSPAPGDPAGGQITASGGVFFVVVRNVGASNGKFTITVTKI
jgi:hypothetical protein